MDMVTYAALQKQMQEIGKDIAVPTDVSAFNNDAGYQTAEQVNAVRAQLQQEIAGKQNALTFDSAPAQGSANPVTSGGVYGAVAEVIAVANGKCKAYVFDTVEALDAWLAVQDNTAGLKTGDVFLIRDVGVPDYWWDANTAAKQILETTKVDLSDYALKTEIPKDVSQLRNDASYQTETQVQAKIAQTEAKIPTVPRNVSAFDNDIGYQTDPDVVRRVGEIVFPLVDLKQDVLTFDSVPTAGSQNPVTSDGVKTAIDEAAEVFYVPFQLGETGFALNGVTHADILTAFRAGKRIIGRVYVPESAGLGGHGDFSVPMTCLTDSSRIVFSFLSGASSVEVFVGTDNSVSFDVDVLQNMESRVNSISSSANNDFQYPTTKAVYDFVIAQTGGLTFKVSDTVPTVDDRSVITFVTEG